MQVFYVALDELQFPLGDSDFTQKWTLLTWPAKIEKQMERTIKVLAADNERYQKEMEGEQALFANTMESLDTVVNNFAQFTDLANVFFTFSSQLTIIMGINCYSVLQLSYNSMGLLVGSWLFCIQHLLCLVSFWVHPWR